MPNVTIFDPASVPVRGLASSRSPFAIGMTNGLFQQLSNWRYADEGVLTARSGIGVLSPVIHFSASGTATSGGGSTLTTNGVNWTVNSFYNAVLAVVSGTGSGQERVIASNTSNQLTVTQPWSTNPDNTSVFVVCANPRSLDTLSFQGNSVVLAGLKDWDTNRTSMWLTTNCTNFVEITSTTGRYGNTRLEADANGNDYGTVVTSVFDRFTGKDCLVIQNGYANPRVFDGTYCAQNQAISSPTFGSASVSRIKPYGSFTMNDSGVSTFTNSADSGTSTGANTTTSLHDTGKSWTVNQWAGATVTITSGTGAVESSVIVSNTATVLTISPAWTGSTPDNTSHYTISTSVNWDWVFAGGSTPGHAFTYLTTSATSGLTGAIVLTGPSLSFAISSQTKQIFITSDVTTAEALDFLNTFKIELQGHSGTWYTIYDPSQGSTTNAPPVSVGASLTNSGALTIWAFPADSIVAGGETFIDAIRITPISSAPAMSANLAINIYGLNTSGPWAGATSFSVSYYNSVSRAESANHVLLAESNPMINYGMSYLLGNLQFPNDDRLFYAVDVYFPQQTQAEANNGTDTARVYAELTDETDYTYVQAFTIATYSGTWVRATPFGTSGLYKESLANAPTDRLLWLISPSDFIAPIPVGRAMRNATGQRLVVGARASTDDSFPQIQTSYGGFPFRFAYAPDENDPLTAYFDQISGENIQAFVNSAASSYAAATTYCFTDKSIWYVNFLAIGTPYFLSRIASVGTGSPRSVSEHRGRISFVDTDQRCQMFEGSYSRPISLAYVDDVFQAVPSSRLRSIVSCWFNYRFFNALTQVSGTLNTNAIIFAENGNGFRGTWESNDSYPAPFTVEGLVNWHPGTTAQNGAYGIVGAGELIALGSDCKTYRMENGTTDLGSNITCTMQTGNLQSPWKDTEEAQAGFVFKHLGIMCDAISSSGTVTRNYPQNGATGINAINLSSANPYTWTWSPDLYDVVGNNVGAAGNILLTVATPGGKQFHGIQVEVEPATAGPQGQ